MMNVSIRFVPIQKWPGEPTPRNDREDSRFRAPYRDTLDLLDKELFQLSARNVIIQAYMEQGQIRNDGWPYSTAQPSQPGVILSFEKLNEDEGRYEEVSFPCDRFNLWEDNLRAIALALEALRKVDRYGVTQHGEQYKGWTRLPAPEHDSDFPSNRNDAAIFMAGFSNIPKDYILENRSVMNEAYRKAAATLHPDNKRTGNHEAFVKLQKAKEILEAR